MTGMDEAERGEIRAALSPYTPPGITRVEAVDDMLRVVGRILADREARLAAVEALHVREGAPNQAGGVSYFCAHCSSLAQEYMNWPCPTIAALHPDPSEASDAVL